jgi:hypothetical protein
MSKVPKRTTYFWYSEYGNFLGIKHETPSIAKRKKKRQTDLLLEIPSVLFVN